MKRISQREAARLAAEVKRLTREVNAPRYWSGDWWPDGVEVARVDCASCATVPASVRTARKLGHAVVAVCDDGLTIRFVALPMPTGDSK